MRFALIGLLALSAVAPLHAADSPFERARLHPRHQAFLAQFMQASQSKNYVEMEIAARAGMELFPKDPVWRYNTACALALQGSQDEALRQLDEAITLGFRDDRHIQADADLESLRATPKFELLVERAKKLKFQPVEGAPEIKPGHYTPGQPALVTASNTLWDVDAGCYNTFFASAKPAHQPAPAAAYTGPAAATLAPWLADDTASGFAGLFYVNRDNGHSTLALTNFPGLTPIVYDAEARRAGAGETMPNGFFRLDDAFPPVLGNCAMAVTHPAYWRSLPRAMLTDSRGTIFAFRLFMANQLFFYPEHNDFDVDGKGDLYPANTPYYLISQGSSWSERPFLEAACAATGALRPDTRAKLIKDGLLAPTLQMLLRSTQKSLAAPTDYLTGLAHPAVFDGANLDPDAWVKKAHALTPETIPPLLALRTIRDEMATPGRDYFDLFTSEGLFDTPCAIARIVRGVNRTRTIVVSVANHQAGTTLHWRVLQGDPAKVTIKPLTSDQSMVEITVAYHGRFNAPLAGGKTIATTRVDVGVIGETKAGWYTCPSFVSFSYLNNEDRVYDTDGRIVSVDYQASADRYTDPMLSAPKHWKDVYRYGPDGRLTGWVRHRGDLAESFTAHGHRVETTDALGRAATARIVQYVPRTTAGTGPQMPDLSQLDTDQLVTYTYASDTDFVGAFK